MNAENLLLTAVTLQREGAARHDIEAALIDLARREAVACHCRRDFSGHVDLVFPDGQCLRFTAEGWTLLQQERLAPLYADAMEAFVAARPVPRRAAPPAEAGWRA